MAGEKKMTLNEEGNTFGIQNLFDVKGKIAVVTGGSRGIGLMITKVLIRNGMTVVISSRKGKVCDEVARLVNSTAAYSVNGGKCVSMPADISTEEGCEKLAQQVMAKYDSIDVLVNNAGANYALPFEEYTDYAWNKVFSLNVKSVHMLSKHLLPALKKGNTMANPARIINIGSVNGIQVPRTDTFAYSASKAAVHMLSKHMALALSDDHITVNAIAPGPFMSKMTEAYFTLDPSAVLDTRCIRRFGDASDIGGTTLFLCSPAATYLTGIVVPVDGGGLLVSGSKL